jgi:DnaK suppressor protein
VTNQELDPFKKRLEQWHADVLRRLTAVERQGRESQPDYPEDAGERSVSSFSKELLFQQASNDRLLLKNVEAAIERVRLRTFGKCVDCENEIGVKRLEAMPFTPYCRECQESIESETRVSHENTLQRYRA